MLLGVAGFRWIISFPFEFSLAWRYVEWKHRLLPRR